MPPPASQGAAQAPGQAWTARARVAFAGSIVGGFLAFLNEVLCARLLGVELYGLYALAVVIARAGEVLAAFGLPVALLRWVAIHRERSDHAHVLGTIAAAVLVPLAVGTALALALAASATQLAGSVFGKPAAADFIRLAAIAIPLMALSEVLGAATRALGRPLAYVLVRNVAPQLAFMALVLAMHAGGAPPAMVAAALAFAYAIAAALGVVLVRRAAAPELAAGRVLVAFGPLYGTAWPILANNVLYLVVGCTSIVAMGIFRSDAEVGVLRAAMQVLMPFEMIELAFVAALAGSYAVLAHDGRRDESRILLEQGTRWLALSCLALLAAAALGRFELLRLMGPGFAAGADALLVMLAGQAALLCTGNLAILLVASGRPRVETANVAFAAVLAVALNAAWVPAFGLMGAALATAVSCGLTAVLRIVQVRRILGIAIWKSGEVRRLARPAALAAGAVIASVWLMPPPADGIPASAARLAAIGIVVAAGFWFGGIDPGERRHLREQARRAWRPVRSRA